MTSLRREVKLFLLCTLYVWAYYLISVLMDFRNPYHAFTTVMFAGSFVGLPVVMFLIVPMLNAHLVGRRRGEKVHAVRVLVHVVLSYWMLVGVLSIHLSISNYQAISRAFPRGIHAAMESAQHRLQETMVSEIEILDVAYSGPYRVPTSAADLSRVKDIEIAVTYKLVNTEEKYLHRETYSPQTGELVEANNSISLIGNAVRSMFENRYKLKDSKHDSYVSLSTIEHVEGLRVLISSSAVQITIGVEHTEPGYIRGRVIRVSGGADEWMNAVATITIHKDKAVEVKVGGNGTMYLVPDPR